MYRVVPIDGVNRLVKIINPEDIDLQDLPNAIIKANTWVRGPNGYFILDRDINGKNLLHVDSGIEDTTFGDFPSGITDRPLVLDTETSNAIAIDDMIDTALMLKDRVRYVEGGTPIMNNVSIVIPADRIQVLDLSDVAGRTPFDIIRDNIGDDIDAIILPDDIIGDFDTQNQQVTLYATPFDNGSYRVSVDIPDVPALQLQAVIRDIQRDYLSYDHMADSFEIERSREYIPDGYDAIIMNRTDNTITIIPDE